jgi:trimethylamine--corrinoid protein Co-methyltransferase
MRANVVKQAGIEFKVLSQHQINEIHRASLEILARTGVKIQCEEALELLKKAGGKVKEDLVKFPAHLVEWAINTTPKQVSLYDRLGNRRLSLGGYKSYFGLGSALFNMIDPQTGKRRAFLKEDVAKAAKIADALPNIDLVMGLGTISNVPRQYSDRHEFEAMVRNTVKPLVISNYTQEGLRDIVEMASAVAGGKEELAQKPFVISYTEPVPPLSEDEAAAKNLLLACEYGLPIIHTPCIQGGATAPVSLAGELVSANAENLSALIIAQLRRRGVPFFIGGVIAIMDMSSGQMSYGSPEMDLALAAYTDMAHYYGIPTWGTAGCTDSKIVDEQAAIEATLSCLFSSLSGANLVHDVGYMESGKTGSLEMIVMVDEILGYIKRIKKGIKVNKETLAVDVIDEVGPGGNFLTHPHTLAHFREEIWSPSLVDRQVYDKWADSGSKRMIDRVREKVQKILETHVPEPLSEEAEKKIEQIIASYRSH